jgi:hypothetical protein
MLYLRYNDGDTTQWVVAAPQPDIDFYVERDGDTMTGPLLLFDDPVEDLEAATKHYVDVSGFPVGTKMLFAQAAPPVGWTLDDTNNDRLLRVSNVAGGGVGGSLPFTTWAANTVTGSTTLDSTTLPYHTHGLGGAIGTSGTFWTYAYYATPGASLYYGLVSDGAGGSVAHPHAINNALQYFDVIVATRDALP